MMHNPLMPAKPKPDPIKAVRLRPDVHNRLKARSATSGIKLEHLVNELLHNNLNRADANLLIIENTGITLREPQN